MKSNSDDRISWVFLLFVAIAILSGVKYLDYDPNKSAVTPTPTVITAPHVPYDDSTIKDQLEEQVLVNKEISSILSNTIEEVEKLRGDIKVVEGKIPKTKTAIVPKPPKEIKAVVSTETFVNYVLSNYRGLSWVEVGTNDASVNHLVNVHGWVRGEISNLSRSQRMKLHGASHSGKVDGLRKKYNKKYGF